MFFDSHAHYDDERFDRDRGDVLKSVHEGGVDYIVNISSDMASSLQSLLLARKYPFIYATVGVHPHDAKNVKLGDMDILRDMASDEKVRAIGEIGLDYHYDFSPRDVQKKWFMEQMALARDLDMPVVIHEREAYLETINIIKSFKNRGVFHCFSGSAESAREVLSCGYMISFTGAVTFKNARRAIEAVKYIPLSQMMIETDCPYMAPEPNRGKRCDSSMLILTAQKIAEIKGISIEEVAEVTKANALEFFSIA